MRTILTITILAALAWTGYWYVGAQAMQEGTNRWLADQQKFGWHTKSQKVETGGFPYRFDTKVTGLELADPSAGWSWSAPEFQFLALSYQPTHFIAFWPDQQKLTIAGQDLSVTSTQMRASAVFKPDPTFELQRSNIVMDDLSLTSDRGWTLRLSNGLFATRPAETGENAHEIGLNLSAITLPEAWRNALDPAGNLPPALDRVALDADVEFDTPLNRQTVQGTLPRITQISLKSAQARWGKLGLTATGDVTVDFNGHPTGQFMITARNWRQILDLAVAGGVVPADLEPAIARALQPVADRSDQPDTISIPIRFSDGVARLGIIPLGPAPRLILR